ncbi:hypothetical protein AeMF1_006599 [Aphanomyces euteiches]|nr:hypothetical protein AeMF1_006599 [Aphanomyces euteiches]KAH9181211.1 hypothetical protein AeNC1_016814 [Aphanomyces euteiches]
MLRIRSVLVVCLTAVVLANDGNQTTVEGEETSREGHEDFKAVLATVVAATVLIVLSILFEMGAEHLRRSTDEINLPFLNTIFSELTTLGFIGSILFVVSKSGSLNHLSETIFGRETELQETVELLHMMLFLFVIIFLCLCMCAKERVGHVVDACCRVILKWGERVQGEFREFERRAPYLSVVLTDYALALESSTNWRNRWSIKRMRNLKKREREMVYISLRRRFVDYRSNHPDPAKAKAIAHAFQLEPETRFPFNEYLNIISGEVLARLIEIDPITWIALEILVVALLFLCWAVGPENEVFVLLISGGVLVATTIAVHAGIHNMRVLLMSPGLFAAAQQRLGEAEWRRLHNLPPLKSSSKMTPQLERKEKASLLSMDMPPPYLNGLASGGVHLEPSELANAQKALLGGGNGVLLAMFLTRLVFLLTALHLCIVILRTNSQIAAREDFHVVVKVLFVISLLLPSLVVPYISTMIARNGLYSFNVEAMKVSRVITKVMRIVKARQTLRLLRFVAEMKVYLREHATQPSSRRASGAAQVIPVAHDEKTDESMPVALVTDATKKQVTDLAVVLKPVHPLAPATSYKAKHEYDEEIQRREINDIFCLFDKD